LSLLTGKKLSESRIVSEAVVDSILSLVENSQRLIDKYPYEPAAEAAFVLEPWNVIRG
jgi:hypothetical protein